MYIDIAVFCSDSAKRYHKWPLRRLGLVSNENGFLGRVSQSKYERIRQYCEAHHLKYRINNPKWERSTDYRHTFFSNNKPYIKDLYFCAYCGRLRSRRYITVDHIYPISVAQKSISLQQKLKRQGIKSINDKNNLVAACRRCNSRKSAKMGLWIIRGKIGKHAWIWELKHAFRISLLISIIWQLTQDGYTQQFLKAFTG